MPDSADALMEKLREMAKVNAIAAHVEKRMDMLHAMGVDHIEIPRPPVKPKVEVAFAPSRSLTSSLVKSNYKSSKVLPADPGEKLYKFRVGNCPQEYDGIFDKLIPLHVVLFNTNYYMPWLVETVTGESFLTSADCRNRILTADDDFSYYQNVLLFDSFLSMVQNIAAENPECLAITSDQDKKFIKLACDNMNLKNFRKAFSIVKHTVDLNAIFKAKDSWAYHFLEMIFLTMSRIVFHLVQYEQSGIRKIALDGVFHPRQVVADVFRTIACVPAFSGPEVECSFNEFRTFSLDVNGPQFDQSHIVKIRPTPAEKEAEKDREVDVTE